MAFLCFPSSKELSQNFTQVRRTYCFKIHYNFSLPAPFLEKRESEKVQLRANSSIEWYPQDLIGQANLLTSLKPIRIRAANVFLACVADETKPRYSPSANQRPKARSVLPGFSIIGSYWLLHMVVLSCTVIGQVAWNHGYAGGYTT